jgi:phosphoglycerate kinase
VDSLFGAPALEAIRAMNPGDITLLENARFFAEEEALADAKPEKMARTHIVQRLAPAADYFCLDAFAAAHRAQPTLVGFAEVLPTMAGRVMQRELEMLDRATTASERPKLGVFGGIKIDDSVAVIQHVLSANIVDRVLAVGGVATAFLEAQGHDPGKATAEFMRREIEEYPALVEQARALLGKYRDRIEVPTDVAVNDGGRRHGIPVSQLPSPHPIADIGLDTIVRFCDDVRAARTVFLNGPAGIFEIEDFSLGTRELFRAVADAEAFTVVGGGHTVAAVEQWGLQDKIDHVSTGGGALIHYLSGRPLPLVEALRRSKRKLPRAA